LQNVFCSAFELPSLRKPENAIKQKNVEEKLTSIFVPIFAGKVFDMDFLQKYLYGVFGLPLPRNAQKRTKKQFKILFYLGLVGSSKINQIYVGVRRIVFGVPLDQALGSPGCVRAELRFFLVLVPDDTSLPCTTEHAQTHAFSALGNRLAKHAGTCHFHACACGPVTPCPAVPFARVEPLAPCQYKNDLGSSQ
jgi:hypothetical protein